MDKPKAGASFLTSASVRRLENVVIWLQKTYALILQGKLVEIDIKSSTCCLKSLTRICALGNFYKSKHYLQESVLVMIIFVQMVV